MAETAELEIQDLHVDVAGKEILKGVNLTVPTGEVHALMGPNGSGKSTLAYTIAGHPNYEVTQGRILFRGQDVLELEPDERARLGLFLAFQYPTAIPGVSMGNFLRLAIKGVTGQEMPIGKFRAAAQDKMKLLKMEGSFLGRYVNDGFSGGEKKRAEILQMALLNPQMAIMDETDSGLDIDALRVVSEGVNALRNPELGGNPNMGVLIITHYQRILNYIKPDYVHLLVDGRIVRSGGIELVETLEQEGYGELVKESLSEPLGAQGV